MLLSIGAPEVVGAGLLLPRDLPGEIQSPLVLVDTPELGEDASVRGMVASGPAPNQIVIRRPDNAVAAITTNTDDLQVGGALDLDLTGYGYTVGVWEANEYGVSGRTKIRTTHNELTGRVTIVDSGTVSNHATHVAGTIGASGAYAPAQGMATQVSLRSYSDTDDFAEMDEDASLMVASNHSYGDLAGWEVVHEDVFEVDTSSDYVDVWWEDYSLYTEDREFGKYTSDAAALDEVLYDNPHLLSVWSAGNHRDNDFTDVNGDGWYITYFSQDPESPYINWQGAKWYWAPDTAPTQAPTVDGDGTTGYDSLSPDQTAKNSLVVGALTDAPSPTMTTFSSYGPTDDGRIKADVMGNGYWLMSSWGTANNHYNSIPGTSMAAPNVTGSSVLLIEHFEDEFEYSPLSATTKAVTLHTADDMGNTGPDYSYGWGLLDAAAAATFITNASTLGLSDSLFEETYGGSQWSQEVLWDGSNPLRATIVWTDPEGTAHDPDELDDTTSVLVNDLDVWITGAGGTYYPWTLDRENPANAAVRTAANHLDNVEQVLIDSPSAGIYTVHVAHTGTITGDSQDFSLMISGAVSTDVEITGFRADGEGMNHMLVDYSISGGLGTLPEFDIGIYRSANGSSLDDQLMYQAVTDSAKRTAGEHTVSVMADFTDPQEDYYLAAKVDSALEIDEYDEDNNIDFFAGGSFYDWPHRTAHVHGTDAVNDAVDVALTGLYVDVTLNAKLFRYWTGAVNEVHIRTHDGNDDVTASAGMDKVLWAFGGDDPDFLRGGAGDDYLSGGTGSDTYYFAGEEEEELGEDTIAESSQPANDTGDRLNFMYLECAVDLDLASTQQQQVATNLKLTLADGNAIEDVYGTDYNDRLWGNDRDNMFIANGGNDSVYGRSGDDYIQGYGGNDMIVGDDGDDEIYGGEGDDYIQGYGGNDQLFGEYDDDEIYGGEGNDYLDSGWGVDILWGQGGDDHLTVYDGEGNDTASGGYGYDIAYGDYGDSLDAEEEYYGGGGRGGESADDDPVILTAEDTSLEELVYGGLQDPKTLARWRELLWFYLEWQKKRTA